MFPNNEVIHNEIGNIMSQVSNIITETYNLIV